MDAAGPSSAQVSIPPNDPRLARCGFAKLQGDGIEFFIRKYEITMGRTSKNSTLDLILGDSTTLSRQHAAIRYNFDSKCFELVVQGKNGVQVESSGSGALHVYTPESPPTPLRSRDLLIMGEKRFYFLLPRAIGVQSRKRRRMEPSPAPVADVTSAPQPVAHPPASVPASAATAPGPSHHQPHPTHNDVSVAAQPPISQHQPIHCTLPSASIPADAVATAAAALGTAGLGHPGVPTASHPVLTTQIHGQSPPKLLEPQPVLQQAHPQPHLSFPPHDQDVGVGSDGLPLQQFDSLVGDEDDALINAGALSYENGAAFGYGAGNNGFPGVF